MRRKRNTSDGAEIAGWRKAVEVGFVDCRRGRGDWRGGFSAAPPLVKSIAETKIGELLHRPVAIEGVSINPYALSAEVRGLRILEREGGATAMSFASLYANVEAESLFRGKCPSKPKYFLGTEKGTFLLIPTILYLYSSFYLFLLEDIH